MPMNYSRLASLSVALSLGLLSFTCSAELLIVNGSTSNTLHVVTFAGEAIVPPGQSLPWPIDTVFTNLWGTNSGPPSPDWVTNGEWSGAPGHDYTAVCPAYAGTAFIADQTTTNTYWFWLGLTSGLGAGLLALGARWARVIITGGGTPTND